MSWPAWQDEAENQEAFLRRLHRHWNDNGLTSLCEARKWRRRFWLLFILVTAAVLSAILAIQGNNHAY